VAAGLGFEWQFTNIVPDQRLAAVSIWLRNSARISTRRTTKVTPRSNGTAYVGDNDTIKFMVAKGADPKAAPAPASAAPRF